MKILYILLGFLACIGALCSKENGQEILEPQPSLCLNMIVKDEADSIVASLESAKPWINYWVIIDLESKDNTAELIKQTLEGIPGELYVRPFVNLEYNRNQALEFAREKADYLLFLDASEKLIADSISLTNQEGYFFAMDPSQSCFHALRLINPQLEWRWIGISDPELFCPEAKAFGFMKECYIEKKQKSHPFRQMHPYAYKQLLSLQELLKRKPASTRACFLIAELYRNAHCPERALPYYQKRAESAGNEEEIFWSLYQMAEIEETLGYPKEEVINSYIKAYNFRPCRIEPKYRLARYYREQSNFLEGYLIAKSALNLNESDDKIPAVKWTQQWIHHYGLWLEYMLCAHYAHLHEEALSASLKLLAMPDLPQAIRGIAENVFDEENPQVKIP